MGALRGDDPVLAARLRLSEHPHAARRGYGAFPARDWRGDRHRREGDVQLRRRAERRTPHAASGGDSVDRPCRDRALAPVRGTAATLVHGTDTVMNDRRRAAIASSTKW